MYEKTLKYEPLKVFSLIFDNPVNLTVFGSGQFCSDYYQKLSSTLGLSTICYLAMFMCLKER